MVDSIILRQHDANGEGRLLPVGAREVGLDAGRLSCADLPNVPRQSSAVCRTFGELFVAHLVDRQTTTSASGPARHRPAIRAPFR